MHIRSEQDIDSEVAKRLRTELGLTQPQFWERVGVKQSGASHLENGGYAISKPLRILLFVNYVAGINLDVTTAEGVARILKLAAKHREGCIVKVFSNNTTKEGVEVKPGQVWRDLNKRNLLERTVRVRNVVDGKAVCVIMVDGLPGKDTTLSIRCMHKGATGWALVSEVV